MSPSEHMRFTGYRSDDKIHRLLKTGNLCSDQGQQWNQAFLLDKGLRSTY